ncbi:MAG: hypothetical protein FD123_4123 [Bacteroidetes bacterium]|nr:MAG: hypothetical protein FD123_4123 [Bacteroidota bacterium]
MGILVSLFYVLLFLLLIRRLRFFQLEGLGKWTPALFFLLKLAAGMAVWAVYTYYYPDASTADIFKYFDDSKIMHDALYESPGDFFRMLFSVGNDTPHFDQLYYQKMNHWYREFDSNLYNDSHTIIRFNAFVRIFSFGYYHVHTVFMCFLSFAGLCALYKTLYPYVREWKYLPAIFIFLFPSVVFWGSGVLKEGLLFFGLGFLFRHFFGWLNDRRRIRLLWIALLLLLLFVTKFYIVVSLVPALLGILWTFRETSKSRVLMKFSLVLVLYITAGIFTDKIFPGYNPFEVLAIKQRDFLNLARGGTYLLSDSTVAFVAPENHDCVLTDTVTKKTRIKAGCDFYYWRVSDFTDTIFVKNSTDSAQYSIMTDYPRAGSLMKVERLEPTIGSIAKNTPPAIWNSLVRPYPWEAKSAMLVLPALESLLILLLLVFFLSAFRIRLPNLQLALCCLVFVFLLFAITGLTTPVIGALVRYRIPGIPLLLLALLLLSDREKITGRWKWLARWL